MREKPYGRDEQKIQFNGWKHYPFLEDFIIFWISEWNDGLLDKEKSLRHKRQNSFADIYISIESRLNTDYQGLIVCLSPCLIASHKPTNSLWNDLEIISFPNDRTDFQFNWKMEYFWVNYHFLY